MIEALWYFSAIVLGLFVFYGALRFGTRAVLRTIDEWNDRKKRRR